jgi:hypothetical protein
MIVADYCGVPIDEVTMTVEGFHETFEQAKAFRMTLPALEVEIEGQAQLISSSLSIARYLA